MGFLVYKYKFHVFDKIALLYLKNIYSTYILIFSIHPIIINAH
jgi:hypothetical protein